jgi:hypothetical protein
LPVSAVDCVQPALHHTREQLFTRFRFGQWSRLALVGILAGELHVGGCGFGNFSRFVSRPERPGGQLLPSSSLPFGFPPLHPSHIPQHLGQFIGLILVGILVVMVLSVIFLYINSVFRFILFDSVLRRECSIGNGWQKWRHDGGRFFLWQIVFQIAVWLGLLFLIVLPLALAFAAGWTTNLRQHLGRLIVGVILFAGLFLVFIVTTIVVHVLARDFLVPIMALEHLDFAEAWHRLLAIVGREMGRFTVYLLLKLVLSIAATILFSICAFILVVFITVPGAVAVLAGKAAGIGWTVPTISLAIIFGSMLLLLMIYLVAVLCVPGTVFFPAYAMYFLASRYPNLDALLNPAPAPPVPAAPPVPESPPPFEAPPFQGPPLPPSAEPIG